MSSKQPNFLIIMTDQQRADHLGCYGNPTVRTPNIDGIAERGTRFEQFYVSNPICQPNRACLATGQMGSVNGVRQNGIPIGLDTLTYADVLRGAGYRTGFVGKAHFQNVSPIPPPKRATTGAGAEPQEELRQSRRDQRTGSEYDWEVRKLWAEDPDRQLPTPYYGFDHVRLCIGHGDQVEGHYSGWLRDRLGGAPDPRGPAVSLDAEANAPQIWRTAVPEELYPTNYIAEEAAAFLRDATVAQPFCLVASFPDPHHPFTPPGRFAEMYDPAEVELPTSFAQKVRDRNDIPGFIRDAYQKGDADPDGYWPFHPDEDHLRRMIALNYGAISMIDEAVGELLKVLAGTGRADTTVVCFTSDHGDYMGDHGAMLKLGLHTRGLLRVPMIWCEPEGTSENVSTRYGSAIDFAPTLLQRAGIRVPVGMQGVNLLGDEPRNPVLVEDPGIAVFSDGDARSATVSLVHDGWRISIFEGETLGELYHFATDPDEVRNLWADPVSASKKQEMLLLLAQRQLGLRDRTLSATAQA